MSDFHLSETGHQRDMDLGELARPNRRHLDPGPLPNGDKKVLFVFFAAAATVTLAILAMGR